MNFFIHFLEPAELVVTVNSCRMHRVQHHVTSKPEYYFIKRSGYEFFVGSSGTS